MWHLLAILACAVGMGVKQTMFSAPLLVLLYDGMFISPSLRTAFTKRRRFYAALFSTWLIVFGIIVATWQESTIDFVNINPLRYALTQPLVILHYLRLAAWPAPLVMEYGWQIEDQWPRIVFPALAVLGMLAVMFRGLWRRKWYGFVAAWFFLVLAPTSSIAPMRQPIFEHRMYLSLAAVVVLAVIGIEYAVRRLVAAPKQRGIVGGVLTLSLVIVLGYLSHNRNRDYHDAIGLWRDNVTHRPQSQVAWNNLGNLLQRAGRNEEAIAPLQSALRINPTHADAHNNLGNALLALGQPREALARYLRALQLSPDDAEIHNNLGSALLTLGQPMDAIAHFRESLRLRPGRAEAHFNWGLALETTGQFRQALEQYREAVRLQPGLAVAERKLREMRERLGERVNSEW